MTIAAAAAVLLLLAATAPQTSAQLEPRDLIAGQRSVDSPARRFAPVRASTMQPAPAWLFFANRNVSVQAWSTFGTLAETAQLQSELDASGRLPLLEMSSSVRSSDGEHYYLWATLNSTATLKYERALFEANATHTTQLTSDFSCALRSGASAYCRGTVYSGCMGPPYDELSIFRYDNTSSTGASIIHILPPNNYTLRTVGDSACIGDHTQPAAQQLLFACGTTVYGSELCLLDDDAEDGSGVRVLDLVTGAAGSGPTRLFPVPAATPGGAADATVVLFVARPSADVPTTGLYRYEMGDATAQLLSGVPTAAAPLPVGSLPDGFYWAPEHGGVLYTALTGAGSGNTSFDFGLWLLPAPAFDTPQLLTRVVSSLDRRSGVPVDAPGQVGSMITFLYECVVTPEPNNTLALPLVPQRWLIFTAYTAERGTELWLIANVSSTEPRAADQTAAGVPRLLVDTFPGPTAGVPNPPLVVAVGTSGRIYYAGMAASGRQSLLLFDPVDGLATVSLQQSASSGGGGQGRARTASELPIALQLFRVPADGQPPTPSTTDYVEALMLQLYNNVTLVLNPDADAICGDGRCDALENCFTCPADCGEEGQPCSLLTHDTYLSLEHPSDSFYDAAELRIGTLRNKTKRAEVPILAQNITLLQFDLTPLLQARRIGFDPFAAGLDALLQLNCSAQRSSKVTVRPFNGGTFFSSPQTLSWTAASKACLSADSRSDVRVRLGKSSDLRRWRARVSSLVTGALDGAVGSAGLTLCLIADGPISCLSQEGAALLGGQVGAISAPNIVFARLPDNSRASSASGALIGGLVGGLLGGLLCCGCLVLLAVLLAAIVAALVLRRRTAKHQEHDIEAEMQMRAMLAELQPTVSQIIPWEHITLVRRIGRGAGGEVYRGLWAQGGGSVQLDVAVKRVRLPKLSGLTSDSAATTTVADSAGSLPGGSSMGGGGGGAPAVSLAAASRSRVELRHILNEVSLLSALQHPAVVQFYGLAVNPDDPNSLFFVIELMHASLADTLRDGNAATTWTYEHMRHATIDVLRGLAFLHGSSPAIIHRDVKPANVLLDDAGHAKLSDFGISRAMSAAKEAAGAMTVVGTPCYTAPEVLQNQDYGVAADIFSFGMLLYEMLTRQQPWHGLAPAQIIVLVVPGQRPDLPAPQPDGLARPHVLDLIRRCWAPNPADRPTAAELLPIVEAWPAH